MKTWWLKNHLCYGGVAVALCALALPARAQNSNTVMSLNPILYYRLKDTTQGPGNLWTNAGTVIGLNSPTDQVTGANVAESPSVPQKKN
jgi:hypothetical protein